MTSADIDLIASVFEHFLTSGVRAIIFAGKGDRFSAGHDLKEAQATRANFTVEQRYAYEEKRYFEYALRILDCPKPAVASVQGACVAGGFMVANMCDMVVASNHAFFADPVCQSLATAAVEVLVHPWVMGLRMAHEFLLTERRLSADQAHRIGMINRLVPRERLETETTELAEKAAAAYPFAVKLLKRSLKRVADIQGFRTRNSKPFRHSSTVSCYGGVQPDARSRYRLWNRPRQGCVTGITVRAEAFRRNAGWRLRRQPLVRDQSCDLRRETR